MKINWPRAAVVWFGVAVMGFFLGLYLGALGVVFGGIFGGIVGLIGMQSGWLTK